MANEKLPPWGTALAGATGAVLANALVYPLDVVKTRLQVQVKVNPPTSVQLSSPPAEGEDEKEKTTKESTSSAAVVAAPKHYTSTWDAITRIVDEEGFQGLYTGMAGSLVGVASTNFAYFYWYTVVRRLYLQASESGFNGSKAGVGAGPVTKALQPGMATELSLGAVAGAFAQLFTIPVAVITTRQQTQPKNERRSFIDTAKEVMDGEDGVSGLWRGLKASLVLVVNPSITYGAYQSLREKLFPGKANLRPWEAFLLGSASKIMATIVTQPLIVAKVGLQSRPPPERKGKPFRSFVEVMRYIIDHEGVLSLFKGMGPQILKGLLVQGLLMMTKERLELLFAVLFSYIRNAKLGDRVRRKVLA